MTLPRLPFPHIPRFFSATLLFIALWAGFGFLLAINGMTLTKGNATSWYLPILSRPLSSDSHAQLAQQLWKQGKTTEAKKEAELAQDLEPTVLGAAVSGKELLAQWEAEPQKQTQTLEYWNMVTQQKPDYRDGFIMAAVASYQLGEIQKARSFINQALALDPASSIAQELLAIFEAN